MRAHQRHLRHGRPVDHGTSSRASSCNRSRPTICRTRHSPSPPAGSSNWGMRWCGPRASPTSGELGWEIYVPTEFMQGVYEEIVGARAPLRAGARRLPCAQFAAHREGLPALGPRHHRRGHAPGGGPGIRREDGTKPAASSAAMRCCGSETSGVRQTPGAIQARVARAPAVPQRAHLAGRLPRRTTSAPACTGIAGRGGRARLRRPPRRRRSRPTSVEPTPTRSRWPASATRPIASLRPLYDPKNQRIKR